MSLEKLTKKLLIQNLLEAKKTHHKRISEKNLETNKLRLEFLARGLKITSLKKEKIALEEENKVLKIKDKYVTVRIQILETALSSMAILKLTEFAKRDIEEFTKKEMEKSAS